MPARSSCLGGLSAARGLGGHPAKRLRCSSFRARSLARASRPGDAASGPGSVRAYHHQHHHTWQHAPGHAAEPPPLLFASPGEVGHGLSALSSLGCWAAGALSARLCAAVGVPSLLPPTAALLAAHRHAYAGLAATAVALSIAAAWLALRVVRAVDRALHGHRRRTWVRQRARVTADQRGGDALQEVAAEANEVGRMPQADGGELPLPADAQPKSEEAPTEDSPAPSAAPAASGAAALGARSPARPAYAVPLEASAGAATAETLAAVSTESSRMQYLAWLWAASSAVVLWAGDLLGNTSALRP